MAGWKKLAKDAAFLTASAVLMRCIGLAYQVWQLVMSVNVFTATLAISGIRFTTTRLVAEELGAGSAGGAEQAVGRCLAYAAFFGIAAGMIQYFCAAPIGFLCIGDARTVKSLRLLAMSLPMISLSCVFNGWFVASGRAAVSAAVQVIEQLSGIGCVMLLLPRAGSDLAECCGAIASGTVAADGASLTLIAALYLLARKGRGEGPAAKRLTGRMLRIAAPLALSAYARTGLTTLENLLVPRKLQAAGYSAERALGGYGAITGMVFPLISFPSCLLGAVAELTVPELTAAQVRGDRRRIDRAVSKLLRWAALFALGTAAFLLIFAEPLGQVVYHTAEVVPYIRVFSLLVPFMYVDIVTDGCLKGLGQMLWSMCFNVAESLIGVLLVVTLLPRWALNGYIALLFICELFNFSLSLSRLRQVADFRLIPRKWRKKISLHRG